MDVELSIDLLRKAIHPAMQRLIAPFHESEVPKDAESRARRTYCEETHLCVCANPGHEKLDCPDFWQNKKKANAEAKNGGAHDKPAGN